MLRRFIERGVCCLLGLTGVLLVAAFLWLVFVALEARSAALVLAVLAALVGVCWLIVLTGLVVLLAWHAVGGQPNDSGRRRADEA